jgi:uncharacterized protein (TIGR03067 family)
LVDRNQYEHWFGVGDDVNILAFTVLAVSLAAPGAKDKKDAPAGVVGTWKLERSTLNGNPLPARDLTVTYASDGKFEERRGEKIRQGTYTTDPKKDPAELDLKEEPSDAVAPPASAAWPAIYKIDGDTMTVCVSDDSKRPKTFDPTPGSGLIVSVFKRQSR